MSLERSRLTRLVEARDLDGITEWVDDVVGIAKARAVDEYHAEVRRVCGPEPATLRDRITRAINATSSENGSNTPDFILAEYLTDCLAAFDRAVQSRRKWSETNR